MWLRVIFDAILLISLLFFAWWITMLLVLFGNLKINYWFECLIAGLFIDSFYGSHFTWNYIPYLFTLISLVLVLTLSKIKKEMI